MRLQTVVPRVYLHAKRSRTHAKEPVVRVRVCALWKQQNNPACTKMIVTASFVADVR